MKKRLFLSLIIIMTILGDLYSIGFGYHIIEARTAPEFSEGLFPSSLLYQFNFPIGNMIQGNKTEINFRLDNGLDFRALRQHPNTGELLTLNPLEGIPTKYMTFYDEMNLVFGQGFLLNNHNSDLLTFWLTVDMHFEKSYERLEYLTNPENAIGLFYTSPKIGAIPGQKRFEEIWIGQPELINDLASTALSLSFGFDLNLMQKENTVRNGMFLSIWTRLNPSWFDLFKDESQDFLLVWNKLDLSYTPLAMKMKSDNSRNWLTLVLDNETIYQFTTGSKIPYYIQNGNIWGTKALNTNHVLTNRTSLTLYGPQFALDFYPSISGFFDIGLSAGQLLNTKAEAPIFDTIMSTGICLEINIFNIASFFYEYGYIIKDTLNKESSTLTRIGFSLGI